jgi:hypothetical protein
MIKTKTNSKKRLEKKYNRKPIELLIIRLISLLDPRLHCLETKYCFRKKMFPIAISKKFLGKQVLVHNFRGWNSTKWIWIRGNSCMPNKTGQCLTISKFSICYWSGTCQSNCKFFILMQKQIHLVKARHSLAQVGHPNSSKN